MINPELIGEVSDNPLKNNNWFVAIPKTAQRIKRLRSAASIFSVAKKRLIKKNKIAETPTRIKINPKG